MLYQLSYTGPGGLLPFVGPARQVGESGMGGGQRFPDTGCHSRCRYCRLVEERVDAAGGPVIEEKAHRESGLFVAIAIGGSDDRRLRGLAATS